MEWQEKLKRNAKCCACEGSLEDSSSINLVILSKVATWIHFTSGNVLIANCPKQAVAVLCDNCMGNVKVSDIKFAIETLEDGEIVYHPTEDLQDIPEEIIEAYKRLESKMFRPNPHMN